MGGADARVCVSEGGCARGVCAPTNRRLLARWRKRRKRRKRRCSRAKGGGGGGKPVTNDSYSLCKSATQPTHLVLLNGLSGNGEAKPLLKVNRRRPSRLLCGMVWGSWGSEVRYRATGDGGWFHSGGAAARDRTNRRTGRQTLGTRASSIGGEGPAAWRCGGERKGTGRGGYL